MSQTESTSEGRTSIRVFCKKHDLEPTLLQIPVRELDTWDVLDRVRSVLDGLPDLQQTVRLGDVMNTNSGGAANIFRAHLWMCGSYPVNPEVSDYRWANPNYTHGDEYQNPVDDRDVHIEKAAQYPSISLRDIGDRFGVNRDAIKGYVYRHDMNLKPRRDASRRTIAKTIRTNVAWTGNTKKSYYKRHPAPNRTVREWVNAPELKDFEPPAMPDHKRWV